MKVVIPPEAGAGVEEIYIYLSARALAAAISWYDGCLEAIRSLAMFPERYPRAPEGSAFGRDIRHLLYGNYRIIFMIHAGSVHILHLRHAARRALGPDPLDG